MAKKLKLNPLISVWKNMCSRCYCKTNEGYKYYGARGIEVCNEWRENKWAFIIWAENNGYKKELQIDRENTHGNYSPDNCRFVTSLVNNSNQRKRIDNTSNYIGVYFSKAKGFFIAAITIKGEHKYICSSNSAYNAAIKRDVYIETNNLPHKLNFA